MLRRALLVCSLLLLPRGAHAQHLTPPPPPEAAQIARWTRFYGGLLKLEAWTIEVQVASLATDNLATSRNIRLGELHAVQVYDVKQLMEEREPWRVVVHELLHLSVAPQHALALELAGDDRSLEMYVNYVFEDLVRRLTALSVWPKPPN